MVIGEQLNQQQQAQQQIATHRIAAGTAATTQQHHRRNSSNSAVVIAQQHQLQQQQQQQQPVSVLSSTISGLNGNNSGQSNTGNSGIGVGVGGVLSNNNSNNNGGNNANNVVVVGGGLVGGGTSAAAAKNQLEQLNTMREALFSQEGWGCQHVNQDTNWEVPSSPEPSNKDPSGGPPMWKPNINNGTDLWESNLRNGGQPPPQPVQKTPWGHTPSSNLGGTWGEDDDGTDSSNVWTGTSANPSASGGVGVGGVTGVGGGATSVVGGPQWGQGNVGVAASGGGNSSNAAASNMGTIVGSGGTTAGNSGVVNAGGVNVAGGSGASGNTGGNGWGDPRDIRSGPMVPIDIRNVDPREAMRAASSGDPRDLRMIDPRDPIRGDPRGISGRLNGTSEMWGQHHPVTHGQIPLNKMIGPGGNASANVAVVAVAGGIGAGVGGISGASGVGGNVNAQWGAAQSVVGPKDIASMTGKQTSGWEEPSPPPQRRNIPNYDDGTSLWGQQSRVPGGGSHWKEMSDPMNRSHLIRSAIGSQNTANAGVGGLNAGGGGGLGAPGAVGVGVAGNPNNPMGSVGGVGPQGRLGVGSAVGPAVGGQLKPDTAMWMHASAAGGSGRNAGSWGDDGSHNVAANSGANWGDEKSAGSISQLGASVGVSGGNAWTDSSAVATWNKNPTKLSSGGGGWGAASSDNNDLANDWAHTGIVGKSQQNKIGGVGIGVGGINSEIIKNSKQYRMLVDTGYKKDDVERALINANMNIEEAADILRTNATMTMDSWRRHDESLGSYGDHSNASGGFQSRYPSAGSQPTIPFPSNNNLLNNMGNAVSGGGNNPGLTALNSMQPLHVQKYLNQGGPQNVTSGPQSVNTAVVAFGQGANVAASAVNAASNSSGQPSAQQLRMLVHQIQLAVHSGYLSSQILNQPLAPATLLLLNQLLSNIKHLQGAQQSLARGNNATNIQLNVAIAKYKQQIQNLQNQINAQQAIYIKQQQQNLQQNPQQHPGSSHVGNSNAEYLRGQHDAINALQGNFSEINLNKQPGGYQGTPNQQSRLNQWKLPVLDKEVTSDSTDFSRAPGATKQSLSSANANSMGPLGMQGDGTWSTGRNIGDGWPDPSNDNENKDWSVAQPSSATAYTDLVQEFEPGKPWKGSQIKSIEDDPSITPGSVARSPLSINPTPKEADIFANTSKSSPTDLPPLSLSSSTWSFNPSSSNQNFPSWSDNTQQCTTSELWSSPMNKTSRGPPPGLGSTKTGVVSVPNVVSVTNPSTVTGSSNGWIVGGRGHNANATWTGTNSSWNSNWLLLKNLPSQVDGPTLHTLCMQHGPIITFHLYLKLGIALFKYNTREEANKAQMTLNKCVLGNTAICAESPSENEMQNILQHLPPQTSNQPGTAGAGNSGGGGNSGNVGNSGSGGSNLNNANNVGGNSSGGSNGGNSNTGAGNNGISGNVNNSSNGVNDIGGSNSNNTGVNGAAGSNSSGAQGQSGTAVGSNINNSNGSNGSNAVGNGGTGGNVNANPVGVGGNNAVWRQTQNQHQHPQNQSRQTDAWNTGSVWQTANPNNSLWAAIDVSGGAGGSSSGGAIAPERGTPSNLKSYLPENLLELN